MSNDKYPGDGWLEHAAAVLAIGLDELRPAARNRSFVELGGTSLGALDLISRGCSSLRETLELSLLLGPDPLEHVLGKAAPSNDLPIAEVGSPALRPLLPGQASMLAAEEVHRSTAYYLIFSAEIRGQLDRERLINCVAQLVRRHESLRTAFVVDESGRRHRQLQRSGTASVVEQFWPGTPTVEAIHTTLIAAADRQLDGSSPAPPVRFVLTTTSAEDRSVLSLLVHHALVDGWAMGLLWRELAQLYATGSEADLPVAGQPEEILQLAERGRVDGRVARLAAERAAQLAACPGPVRLPTTQPRPEIFRPESERLVFEVPAGLREACDQLARQAGVTHTAVLMTCWALTVARRCDLDRLLVGLPVAGRTTPAMASVVGLCTRIVPVDCDFSEGTVLSTVRGVAASISDALTYAEVPFEDLVAAAGAGGDLTQGPLVQVTLASHEQFVPEQLEAGATTWRIHEGHCRGTAFDATLFVQRWEDTGRLALEYSLGSLEPQEAAAIAEGFVGTLTELTGEPDRDIREVRGMSERQKALLAGWQHGAELVAEQLPGLWELLTNAAAERPTGPAVRTTDAELTFAELYGRAEEFAGRLHDAGVREGSAVLIAQPRGLEEIVAVLGVLRLGACYVGISADDPADRLRQIIETAQPVAMVGELPASVSAGVPRIAIPSAAERPADSRPALPVLGSNLDRASCLAFTSGSTGTPKCTPIPERGIVRLVVGGNYLGLGPGDRFLRLAPLAFDASTLEIFTALGSGAGLEVFPDSAPHPDALAGFLTGHSVTHAWLTAGLFRLVADHRPDAFASLKVLLTGGDVLPVRQVSRVTTAHPHLRLVNGYGPTENTVFSTVSIIGPTALTGSIPVGRPIAGTDVRVLDGRGRAVPPGGLGEIVCSGLGVGLGYSGDSGGSAFTTDASGTAIYRTGDLGFWTGDGQLAFVGRRDRQLKLAGHRIEPAGIEAVLRQHPEVRDAVVLVEETAASDGRLVAAIIADERPNLVEELVALTRGRLPAYSIPARWMIATEYPLTPNGKIDLAAVVAAGKQQTMQEPVAHETPVRREPAESGQDLTDVILEVWEVVLGHDDFDVDDRFFDVGGSSLRLTEVRDLLRRRLPAASVSVLDLFRHPTPRAMADHLTAGSTDRSRR